MAGHSSHGQFSSSGVQADAGKCHLGCPAERIRREGTQISCPHTPSDGAEARGTGFWKCALLAASSRSLRGLKNSCSSEWPGEPGKGHSLDSDEGSLSSGTTQSSGCPAADGRRDSKGGSPGKGPAGFSDSLIKESDILSDEEDDGCRPPPGGGSPTRDIEIQFQRLSISDDPEAQAGEGEQQSKLVRGHFCPIKRKANSTKRDRSSLVKAQTRHQSLDCQSDNASLDLNAVLEREFSVQSLTSVVSEECFYQPEGHGKS